MQYPWAKNGSWPWISRGQTKLIIRASLLRFHRLEAAATPLPPLRQQNWDSSLSKISTEKEKRQTIKTQCQRRGRPPGRLGECGEEVDPDEGKARFAGQAENPLDQP